jgi:hypothetical protein
MQTENITAGVSGKRKILFILFSAAILFFILVSFAELLLFVFKFDSAYIRMQNFTMEQAKWWACDSINGPRYLAKKANAEDSVFLKNESWYYNRLKIVNNEGYHDSDNFRDIPVSNDSLKILFAGDSFTWGASADVDSSYVEVFEQDIRKVYPSIIWNTGIPATGTNHAIFTTRKFLPLQKTNFVILGFFTGNDFSDNLLPFDQLVFTNQASCFNLCDVDRDFRPYRISRNEAFKKATGSYPMEELNILQKMMVRSRLVTFTTDMWGRVLNRLNGTKKRTEEQQYTMTRKYLKELNEYVKKSNAELIVVVIPSWPDLEKRDEHYNNALSILNELSIKNIETLSLFQLNNYRKSGGGHWVNSGHIIAGHALSQYLLKYMKEKQSLTSRKPVMAEVISAKK